MIDKILYFGYVVMTSFKHWRKLWGFSNFYSARCSKSSIYFLFQSIMAYIRYSMHPLDYFYFDVYNNKLFNPQEHANTLFMYQFQKKLNQRKKIKYFHNKSLFNYKFKELIDHDYLILRGVSFAFLKQWLIARNCESIILKKNNSVGGSGVKRIRISVKNNEVFIDNKSLVKQYKFLKEYDLAEEFVKQHEEIERLNPSCLNTVRVVTVLTPSGVDIIGAVLRLGVNNDIDNFHSGGIAVNIDLKHGTLSGDGFRLAPSDPLFYKRHPVTKVQLNGYQLPYWVNVLDTVRTASKVIPGVQTVGWDVAITNNGVDIIEGNHDWDKIIIEKALKRGIKRDLLKYI